MRILVTGSAGFIGFHLARRLLAEGHRVTGFDAMTSYYDVALKEARVAQLVDHPEYVHVVGRLEDAVALRAAADPSPDAIIHLAAQAGVRYSLEAPATYVDSNLTGSFNVLELARAIQPSHLMMASTSSLYGANAHIPFSESDRADEPLSLYAATKKGMEAMAHSYSHLFHIPITAFRFFTVYGPWGRPDMALFKFVDAIRHDRPIDVYGLGDMARDFTYIDDLVEAVIRLLAVVPDESNRVVGKEATDTLSAQAPYRTVNIAGGQPVQLMSFIETVEAALGTRARLNMMEMQPGDVPRTFADPALLKALTGYLPETNIETGVREFVEWHLSHYHD